MSDTQKAKLEISLDESDCTVSLFGNYSDLIVAICGGITAIVTNMSTHPRYLEIMDKYEISKDELRSELMLSVVLQIMDRLADEGIDIQDSDVIMTNIADELSNENVDLEFNGDGLNCDDFEMLLNEESVDGDDNE